MVWVLIRTPSPVADPGVVSLLPAQLEIDHKIFSMVIRLIEVGFDVSYKWKYVDKKMADR